MEENSQPPSPELRATSNMSSPIPHLNTGFFSTPFEKFKDDAMAEFAGALTLLDTIETFFDSRIDLWERRIKKHGDRLKMKAEEALKRTTRTQSGELISSVDIEKELNKLKGKLSERMTSLTTAWQSAKVVRTREKVSFFFGVMSLLMSALMFGMAPQWVHVVYTIFACYLLPLRAYTYKKKLWHYFLFDLCYYSQVLNMIYIWLAPSSPTLFVACYCLAHGSLASAVITWRNSLVFHDADKVTSLFIHIYPPFTFTVIRHFYPNAAERFPALRELPHLQPMRAILFSAVIYIIWQGLYWKFVLVDRRTKIESGQRTTSFSFLLNDKRGVIGRMLASVPADYRLGSFMFGQLVYAILTELPAVFLLYDSAFWSGAFLLFIFGVSVWNGGGFYIEVFGRKFERELEALRKELAIASANRSGAATPSSHETPLPGYTTSSSSEDGSPIVTPNQGGTLPADGLSLEGMNETKKDR